MSCAAHCTAKVGKPNVGRSTALIGVLPDPLVTCRLGLKYECLGCADASSASKQMPSAQCTPDDPHGLACDHTGPVPRTLLVMHAHHLLPVCVNVCSFYIDLFDGASLPFARNLTSGWHAACLCAGLRHCCCWPMLIPEIWQHTVSACPPWVSHSPVTLMGCAQMRATARRRQTSSTARTHAACSTIRSWATQGAPHPLASTSSMVSAAGGCWHIQSLLSPSGAMTLM